MHEYLRHRPAAAFTTPVEAESGRCRNTWPSPVRSIETKSRRQAEPPRCPHQLARSPALGGRATTAIYWAISPRWSDNYEECIGAKKHLVLGLLSHTGPTKGSTGFTIG